MQIAATTSVPADVSAILIPIFTSGAVPSSLPASVGPAVERMLPVARAVSTYETIWHYGDPIIGLVNVGDSATLQVVRLRRAATAAFKSIAPLPLGAVSVVLSHVPLPAAETVAAFIEGYAYAAWRPEAHRTTPVARPRIERLTIVTKTKVDPSAISRAKIVGEAVELCRRLANEPANLLLPRDLAEEAVKLASSVGLESKVLDRAACQRLGMNAFLSVAAGSQAEPALIVLRHRGRAGSDVDLALVGKGITFDSGGTSLKAPEAMYDMKADMTGAASVIAALGAIAKLRVPANVVAIAPATENLPGGTASRPGDVVTSMSGLTVEIRHTDAEGRLILIDAVTYACTLGARRIIDVATLTHSIAGSFGNEYIGAYGSPDEFVREVVDAGNAVGDRLWPLPISDEIREEIAGSVGDIANSTQMKWGDAAKGAAFIERGLTRLVPWVHLDLGLSHWAESERRYCYRGAQGTGVRTLIEMATRVA